MRRERMLDKREASAIARKSYSDIEDAVCPALNALIKIIVCHSPKDDWMSFLFHGFIPDLFDITHSDCLTQSHVATKVSRNVS